jgi:hypothetical protein
LARSSWANIDFAGFPAKFQPLCEIEVLDACLKRINGVFPVFVSCFFPDIVEVNRESFAAHFQLDEM